MRKWRAIAATVMTFAVVFVVAVAALLADGRVGSESVSNDGGAWLLNRSEGVVGHVNRVVGEVDTTVGPFTGAFDVAQARDIVVVHDRGAGRAALVDTTQAAVGAVVSVPATVEVSTGPGTVVLHDTATGDVWRFSKEEFGAVESLTDEAPLVRAGAGSTAAVGRLGDLVVANATGGTVWFASPGAPAEQFELAATESPAPVAVNGATFVGDTAVVAIGDELVTVADGATNRLAPVVEGGVEGVIWQQPSYDGAAAEGDAVVGITTGGDVIAVDLESGAEISRTPIEGDGALAPIVHDGCVWTVTTSPSPVFHHCGVASPLPTAGTSLQLVLVNGWVWVNDVDQGGIWVVDEDELEVQEISDWTAALDLVDANDEIDDNGGGDEELIENSNADELTDEVDELDEDDRNTPPVAEDDEAETRRGRPIVVRVLDNDTDEDNDPLAVESLIDVDASGATAAGAFVSITADGSAIQVTPPEDFLGEIRFGYTVHDGRQGRDDATVRVTVVEPDAATNRPPVTEDDNATVRAGKSVALNVLNNDTDPDGDVLVLLSVDGADGAITYAPDGEIAYAPDVTSEAGTIELAYVVADDYGAEATGTVRIRVRSADSNQPPQARNDVGGTSVGRPVILDVLANDMDPDGDPLSVQSLASLDDAVTSAQLTPDGRFLFRPEAPGTFRFVYTVSDGPEIDQAQIRVDVDDVADNRPPIAQLDEVALAIGESRLVRVLDNDGDPDGDVVGVVDWIGAAGLEITEVPGVGFNVMATPSAEPRTTFRYWISDGMSDPVRGDVIVSALEREPVDYPPIAVADTVDVRAGRTSELRVLRNDHDPEGKFLRLAEPLADLPEGLLRMSPDRQHLLLTVDPAQVFGFQFTYDIEDPAGNRSSAVVDVRIVDPNQPNRAPIAGPDVARTSAETPIVIDVEANDYDPDGDPITVESIAEQPDHGTVVLRDDGTIEYTPEAGFSGTDSFVYTLVDGYQAPADSTLPPDQRGPARDLGQVYIGVMPPETANRAPVAVDDIGFPEVEIGAEPLVLDVLGNDSDPDNDPLRVTEVTPPATGTARVGGNERFVEFTPPADGEPRQVAFGYSIADGRGGTASAQVILELVAEPEPVPPVAVDDTVGPVRARTEIEFDPRRNDLDPDGERDELEVVADSPLMAVTPDGTVVMTAPTETSEVPYRVRDADGLVSEPAFVTVLVAENEAPAVSPIEIETPFNEPVVIDLHDAVVDPDGDPLVITLGSQRTGGSVSVVGQPADSFLQVEFTPDTDFDGTASFDFTVDDRMGHTVAGKATIEVLPPENRPPEAGPITIDATAGVPAPIRLPSGVTDPDGPDGHSFRIGDASSGAVTLDGPSADGTVTVRSAVDAGDATITFDYTVVDADYTATSTVTINLSVADFPAPTVTDDSARVLQGQPTPAIDLLANDVDNSPADLRGAGLTVTSVGVTDAGQVEQRGNSVVFTPSPDFFGEASFTYTVQDGRRSVERESTGLVTVQVVGRPAQPQPPVVDTVGNQYVIVGWQPPSGDAARAPVTGYVLRYSAADGSTGSITFDRPTTSYRWENLTNAVEYCFTVAASNEAGLGEFSEQSACRAPDVRPERPAAPTVQFGDGDLRIDWTPPLNQGSDIINYQLRISGGDQDLSPELGVTTSYTWEGLENGTDYTFEVRAQNAAASDQDGWSDWSPLSAPEHPLTVPDAPAQPQAVRGDRQVEVTWNAPYDGGDTITRYQVRSSLSSTWVDVTPQGTVNTHTWENIPNGTDVSFTVRAVNRDPRSTTPGNISPASPVVRTCSVPDAPAEPTVARGDKAATITWTPPADQGCAITEYRVTGSGGAGTQTASAGATSHQFTGLTNGTSYTFTVTAVNEVVTVDGRSPSASPASDPVTPAGPPFATTVTDATNVGPREVRVRWNAADDNGSPITSYQIQVNGGSWTDVGNVTQVTRTESSNGATYSYRVRAVNSVGAGAQSNQVSVTTWSLPGAPNVSSSRDGDRAVRSTWNNPNNGGTGFTGQQVAFTQGSCPGSGSGISVGTTSYRRTGLSYDTTYRTCVRYRNAVGWGNWGSDTARTNSPPQPSVTAIKGATYYGTNGSCSPGDCAYIDFHMRNFAPNRTYNWYINTQNAGGWGNPRQVTTNGNGEARKNGQSFSIGSGNGWPLYGHNYGWVEVCIDGVCDRVTF